MNVIDAKTENPSFRETTIQIAEELLATMLANNLTQEPDRKAVFLTVWKKGDPTCYFKTKIGTTFPDDTFRTNCCIFSEEKLQRTFDNPGHVSSWQSRNPDENKWGGAVVVDIDGTEWGVSVSGLKEWEDETMSLIIGRIGYVDMDDPRVQEIVAISNRPDYIQSVAEVFKW